jgi:hypothetical protein
MQRTWANLPSMLLSRRNHIQKCAFYAFYIIAIIYSSKTSHSVSLKIGTMIILGRGAIIEKRSSRVSGP